MEKNFVKELESQLGSLVSLIKSGITEEINAIDDSKEMIQRAYDRIKEGNANLNTIGSVLEDFACDIEDIATTIIDEDAEDVGFMESMAQLVADGYIYDEDVEMDDDFDDEDDIECVSCDECENPCNAE